MALLVDVTDDVGLIDPLAVTDDVGEDEPEGVVDALRVMDALPLRVGVLDPLLDGVALTLPLLL